MASIAALAAFVLLVAAVAGSGAAFEPGTWYQVLPKPSWVPPNWVFPIAWTVLYLMIAVSGWLVWRQAGFAGARLGFTSYFLQLAFNAAWSWLFFGLHRIELALIDLILMWFAVIVNIAAFYAISSAAAYLLAPYLLWVSYAGALNFAIWQMHR